MRSAFFKYDRQKGAGILSKMLVILTMVFIISISGVQHIYGYTAVKGTVEVKSGKARKSASTKAEMAFGVSNGETVTIIGEEKGDDGKIWYKIKVLGTVGYLRSDLVKKTNIEVKSESTAENTDSQSVSVVTENSTKKESTTTSTNSATTSGTTTSTSGTASATTASGTAAASTGSATVKGSNVIVRSSTSTKSSVKCVVQNGMTLTVVSTSNGDDGKVWCNVSFTSNGTTVSGYIRSDLVNMNSSSASQSDSQQSNSENTGNSSTASSTTATGTTTSNTTTKTTATVKGNSVIVREESTTKSGVKTVVNSGTEVKILNTVKGEGDKDWYNVSLTVNGTEVKGYIRSDLINVTTETVKITDTNQTVTVSDSAISSDSSSTSSNSKSPQVGKIKGTGVNIRKSPVNGDVICRLSTGSSITVTDQVKGSDGYLWYAISFIANKTPQNGYVRSDFTEGITPYETSTVSNTETNKETQTESEDTSDEYKESKDKEAADKDALKNEQNSNATTTTVTTASIKGYGVRIRETAVTGNVIAQLDTGYPVEILEEKECEDGYKWYKIKFTKNDKECEGYVRSDLVTVVVKTSTTMISDEEFESQIAEFPETYKASLRAIHEKYPNWKFVPVNTGLEWSDVVSNESRVGKNLIAKSSMASWKSTEPQAYDWSTNTWYGFDGGSWASASTELIQYYLDPRNFLDEYGIFQFETLGFEEYQTVEGVSNVLKGTFMSGDYTDADGAQRNYAESFYEAGKAWGVNPYHLASRAVQEQGTLGTSQSISGTVSGLENLFNFFNIGAYAANGNSATINGLIYAAGTDEDFYRPWNTRYRSIVGSGKYVGQKYVSVGQNTLYFQKFNVVNSENGIYSHQYMSNVVAASYESARMRKAYSDLNTTLVFRIPYYNNMPESNCVKPTSDSNPNTYLSNLWVDGFAFTTQFSSVTNTYYLNVGNDIGSINVGATAVSSSSSVGGTGTYELVTGENRIQVVCKSQSGATKTYTIVVNRSG